MPEWVLLRPPRCGRTFAMRRARSASRPASPRQRSASAPPLRSSASRSGLVRRGVCARDAIAGVQRHAAGSGDFRGDALAAGGGSRAGQLPAVAPGSTGRSGRDTARGIGHRFAGRMEEPSRWKFSDPALLWLFPASYVLHFVEELATTAPVLVWTASLEVRSLSRPSPR